MQAKLVLGWRSSSAGGASACCAKKLRLVTTKAPNRAAVHGRKRPISEKIINEEEVKMEIQKERQEKLEKRKEVEKTLDSQLNLPDKVIPPS
ncbi:hypothetical protein M0R45_032279 [Rubus argutus]|uniref:Uncharacterized protein n=1 Tax=Rubus argutus TaxID=59490 RepID=A0AAW1WGR4_RUBAR